MRVLCLQWPTPVKTHNDNGVEAFFFHFLQALLAQNDTLLAGLNIDVEVDLPEFNCSEPERRRSLKFGPFFDFLAYYYSSVYIPGFGFEDARYTTSSAQVCILSIKTFFSFSRIKEE